jgi:hypothetical protein
MADIDRLELTAPREGDEALLEALLMGAHVQNAAMMAGVSERTAYRRLADPRFQEQLGAGREAIRECILTRLTEAAGDAVSCLWDRLSDDDSRVQVQAAKVLLDSLVKIRNCQPQQTRSTTVQYSVEHKAVDG